MTTISILPEIAGPAHTSYRAVAGKAKAVGKTPGEALDAISKMLDEDATSTVVVIQQFRPDEFFTAEQQQRLGELMTRWRTARDTGGPWSSGEQNELDALAEDELRAAGERAAALVRRLMS